MTTRIGKPRLGATVTVASLLINLLGAALPLALGQVYDRIIPNHSMDTLTVLCAALVLVVAVELAVTVSRASLTAWAGAHYEHELRAAAMEQALTCELRDFEAHPPGAHVDAMAGVDRLRDHYAGDAPNPAAELPSFLLYCAALFWLSPLLALAPVTVVLLGAVLNHLLNSRLLVEAEARMTVDGRRYSFLMEALRNVETIKSLGIEPLMERRYERLVGASAMRGRSMALLSNMSFGLQGLLAQSTTVAIGCVGAWLAIHERLSVGALAACLLLGGRMVQPALKLQAGMGRSGQASLSRQRLQQLFELPRPESGDRALGAIRSIALRDASYLSRTGEPIIRQADLELNVGETVAVQGGSGSGKTTLMWLLSGALQPDGGKLLINGVDAREYHADGLRRRIALLTQTPTLLRGSIAENVASFDVDDRMDTAMEVVRALKLERFFAEHTDSATDNTAEAARAKLPASILNAVAVARGLSGAPEVVLFDEANLMLDGPTDKLLLDYLRVIKPRVAMVLVTHRPSYLALADRTYRLDRGRLLGVTDGAKSATREAVAPTLAPVRAAETTA